MVLNVVPREMESDISPKWSSFSAATRRERLPWPTDRAFRILSIDGGGIRGIFPAAVLARMENELLGARSVADYFDMIVGTSTGGILALGLGAGWTAQELLDMYVEEGGKVFPPPGWLRHKLRRFDKIVAPRYDRAALKVMLQKVLGDKHFADSSKHLCIPAYDGRHGEVHIFKTPFHPAYTRDGYDQMTSVALATAAAPTYYPAFDSGGYRYIDGGVWANCPAMIGVVDALACFDIVPGQVRILSLGCGRDPALVDDRQARGGDWAWRYALFAAMELQTQNVLGQAKLLAGPSNVVRVDPSPGEAIELDDWKRAKDELPALAVAEFAKVKERLRETFCGEPVAQMRRFWPPAP